MQTTAPGAPPAFSTATGPKEALASAAMLYYHLPIVDVFRRLDVHTLLGVIDARGIPQPFVYTLPREGGERRRLAGVIASVDTRQQLAMEPHSRRYIWIPGPITTVHGEHPYRELTVAAKIRLTTKRWISDRSRSAAVVLGNHPISVRRIALVRLRTFAFKRASD
jgi:hypothetical protein